jgi:hypothetical protein
MSSGRYRVIVTGFTVQSETWDDVFQWDGKRDEVYLAAKVVVLNAHGNALMQSEPVSKIMGDTNQQNGRIKAGSASSQGGLRTGDSFPTPTPWIASTAPSTTRNYPPLKLWEGDLDQGQNACVIAPSIWEDDTSGPIMEDWVQWVGGLASKLGSQASALVGANVVGQAIIAATQLGLGVAVSAVESGIAGSAGDRPIGMVANSSGAYVFDPQVLRLTYDIAESLIRQEPAGKGRGVLALRYRDSVRLQGDYILYVKVEKVDAVEPAPAPRPSRPRRPRLHEPID